MQNIFSSFVRSGLAWLWVSYVVVVADCFAKKMIVTSFKLGQEKFINEFISIRYVENAGAAFSIFSDGYKWQYVLLVGSNVIILAVLLYILARSRFEKFLYNISLSLVIAGAIGNLIDRISFGVVIDFIYIHVKSYHWPIFNIADIAICLGAFILILTTKGD